MAAPLCTVGLLAACGGANGAAETTADALETASPIKHVIIVVGENRSFDHVFATYVPRHPEEGIHNLLSEEIVTAGGAPGRLFSKGYQYQITSVPNGGSYFISADLKDKTLYDTLPPPDVYFAPAVSPDVGLLSLPGGDPELPPQDQFLLATGGTGLSYTLGPDSRIAHVFTLPPGPFQLTGPTLAFDTFTADMSHQYFTMVQQVDCAVDAEHVSSDNPTGCLHDLQAAVNTTYPTPLDDTPHDTGQTMGFFNMQQGDAPVFKALADQFTLSDNYHQPVFGGTWADSMVQWVDFFGTGPRIPLIAVSPFSTGGHVSHVYGEHSSFVKFIERNWKLSGALSDRSRDNLPNPLQNNKNPMCRRTCPPSATCSTCSPVPDAGPEDAGLVSSAAAGVCAGRTACGSEPPAGALHADWMIAVRVLE